VLPDHNEKTFLPVTNWAPIIGLWKFEDGRAVYVGPQEGQRPGFGICISDVRFLEGEARATFRQPSGDVNGRLVLGYQSLYDDYYLIGVGGHSAAYTIVHFDPIRGWRPITVAGAAQNLRVGHAYKISVRIHGVNG
jgi:hypothetical protein